MENIKSIIKWGNGGGVLLPKEWIGKEAKIILINRTLQIRKEVLEMLEPYLEDISGIYLAGSYARNEQTKDSDIDIIAISASLNKEVSSGRYHISIYSLESIKKTLEENPLMIYPRLKEAKPLLNRSLLEKLSSIVPSKKQFKEFILDTKEIIKINEEIIDLDKLEGENLSSLNILYSLLLRIRAVFLMNTVLEKKKYSNGSFIKWAKENVLEDFDKIYLVYNNIKNNKKLPSDIVIKIESAEKVLNLLKNEVTKFD